MLVKTPVSTLLGHGRFLPRLPPQDFDGGFLLVDDALPELLQHGPVLLGVEELLVDKLVFQEIELLLRVAVVQSCVKKRTKKE